jgi:hypothetical protein
LIPTDQAPEMNVELSWQQGVFGWALNSHRIIPHCADNTTPTDDTVQLVEDAVGVRGKCASKSGIRASRSLS